MARYFFVTSSRASARLIRVARSGVLHLISSGHVNVQCVGAALSGNNYRRRVVVVIRGIRGGLLRLFKLRLSVACTSATVKCVPLSRKFRFCRVLCTIVSGRRLSIATRFGVSHFHCSVFVGNVRLYLGKVAIKEQDLGGEGVANTRWQRLRDAKSKNDNRDGYVRVRFRLARLLFRAGSRLLFLVGSRRSWVFRLGTFASSFVYASRGVCFSVHRFLRCFKGVFHATNATRVVRLA